jgi:hypothetical protein
VTASKDRTVCDEVRVAALPDRGDAASVIGSIMATAGRSRARLPDVVVKDRMGPTALAWPATAGFGRAQSFSSADLPCRGGNVRSADCGVAASRRPEVALAAGTQKAHAPGG